jgi:hypothetical protein
MKKYVYVIFDPLYEKVVCVHNEPDIDCLKCKKISKERTTTKSCYFLEESKHLVKNKLNNRK